MRILGIETSCDETAVCLIEASGEFPGRAGGADFSFRVLGNALLSQAALHSPYGGVFPNLAKREHQKNLVPILIAALKDANSLAVNKDAFNNVNSLLVKASKVIEQIDEVRADPLIQNEFREALNNANEAAKKLSTTSDEVSMLLKQRFLFPRLFFGKLSPGEKKKEERAID